MYQKQCHPNTARDLPSISNRRIRRALDAALTDLSGLEVELSATQPNGPNHVGSGELLLLLRQIARGIPPSMQSYESLLQLAEQGRPESVGVPSL